MKEIEPKFEGESHGENGYDKDYDKGDVISISSLQRLFRDAEKYCFLTPEQEIAYGEKAYPYFFLRDEKEELAQEVSLRKRMEKELQEKGKTEWYKRSQGSLTRSMKKRLAIIRQKKEELLFELEKLGSSPISNLMEEAKITAKSIDISKRLDALEKEEGELKNELEKINKTGCLDIILCTIRIDNIAFIQDQLDKDMAPLQSEAEAARNALVSSNIKLVISIAKRYRLGLDLQTAIAEGNIGLLKAAEKYNPKKRKRFSTFAFPCISKSILRKANESKRTIHLSDHDLQTWLQIKEAESAIYALTMKTATDEEIAAWLEAKRSSKPHKATSDEEGFEEEMADSSDEIDKDTLFLNDANEAEVQNIIAEAQNIVKEVKSKVSPQIPKNSLKSDSVPFIELYQKILKQHQQAQGKEKKRIDREMQTIGLLRSLRDETSEDGDSLLDLQSEERKEEEKGRTIIEAMAAKDRRRIIDLLFSKARITPREDQLLRKRVGLGKGEEYDHDQSLEEIGVEWGMSRAGVHKIEVMALNKIRRILGLEGNKSLRDEVRNLQ